jgi:hypothetical protein
VLSTKKKTPTAAAVAQSDEEHAAVASSKHPGAAAAHSTAPGATEGAPAERESLVQEAIHRAVEEAVAHPQATASKHTLVPSAGSLSAGSSAAMAQARKEHLPDTFYEGIHRVRDALLKRLDAESLTVHSAERADEVRRGYHSAFADRAGDFAPLHAHEGARKTPDAQGIDMRATEEFLRRQGKKRGKHRVSLS